MIDESKWRRAHSAYQSARARGAMPTRSHAAMHSTGIASFQTKDQAKAKARPSYREEAVKWRWILRPQVSEVWALGYLSSNEV
jgi:hypothetical protein